MNGAERSIETARAAGLELCLANPGTTEMPLVLALDRIEGIRAVLGLHENICTGAADGYARIAGKPAMVLLHLGPGLGNGLANLHNARRARSPVLVLVGEHATWHMSADAPLAMDIEAVAGSVSRWVGRVAGAEDAGRLTGAAIAAATGGTGGVATLVFPHDLQLAAAGGTAPPPRPVGAPTPDPGAVALAAERLRGHGPACLYLGGRALWGEGLQLAGRIAAATGAVLLGEVGFARLEAGRGRPPVERLPYFPEQAQALLDSFNTVVGIGAREPVTFFGWPGKPNRYLDGRDGVVWVAGPEEDAVAGLRGLADAIGEPGARAAAPAEPLAAAEGQLDAEKLGIELARAIPADAIVVVTAVTSAAPFSKHARHAAPHTQLALTGGAIGEGPALAIGAALAAPGQKVVNLEADGSGAYALQAFWTQAREDLDITTIICANRSYRILQLEMERAGINRLGPVARDLTDLARPPMDWVKIAEAQGVPGAKATTAEALRAALAEGLARPGPFLIEAEI